jgi:hypothetical protein
MIVLADPMSMAIVSDTRSRKAVRPINELVLLMKDMTINKQMVRANGPSKRY